MADTTRRRRIELRFRRAGTRHTAVGETSVTAIGLDTQKPLLDERIKDGRTHRPIDAAQTMHLIRREQQSGHFQKFSSEAFNDVLHINLARSDAMESEIHISSNTCNDSSAFFEKVCKPIDDFTATSCHDDAR